MLSNPSPWLCNHIRPKSFCRRPYLVNTSIRGFTLLEVILALAIAALLLLALGSAIRIQMKAMDVGRTDVEEAQVARAVMKMIADDLRGAMFFKSQDVSGATGAVASATGGLSTGAGAGAGASSGSSSSSGGSTSGTSGSSSTSSSSSGSSTTTSPASDEVTRRAPGIYGDQYTIEIDVNRVPREDEYDLLTQQLGDQSVGVHPSEVRTVSYFVSQGSGISSTLTATTIDSSAGLLRGERDRPSAAYLYSGGTTFPSSDRAEVIAPEVQAIEFRYFDGTSYYDSWDTELRSALPMAVEVMIQVRTSNQERGVEQARGAVALDDVQAPGEWLVYRLTVKIPQGKASSADDESGGSSSSSSASSSGSSGGSGSGSSSSGASGGTSGGSS